MTNSQQKILASLEANRAAALAVGLIVNIETEDCGRFVSVSVRVRFGAISGPRRMGHDQEFYCHLLIGKRGGIDGTARLGSIFGDCIEYKKGSVFGEYRPNVFEMLTRDGCKYAFDDMIRTANNMAEYEKGAA